MVCGGLHGRNLREKYLMTIFICVLSMTFFAHGMITFEKKFEKMSGIHCK